MDMDHVMDLHPFYFIKDLKKFKKITDLDLVADLDPYYFIKDSLKVNRKNFNFFIKVLWFTIYFSTFFSVATKMSM